MTEPLKVKGTQEEIATSSPENTQKQASQRVSHKSCSQQQTLSQSAEGFLHCTNELTNLRNLLKKDLQKDKPKNNKKYVKGNEDKVQIKVDIDLKDDDFLNGQHS